jgi:hypothetical protein
MASLKKRFRGKGADAPPVSTPPEVTAAELPPVAADTKPPEMPKVESSPADEAGKAALKQRLAEMERAEAITREAVQQLPQFATEPPPQPQEPTFEQQIAHLPERIQRWCRSDPRFLTDPEKISQVQYCHWVARREIGEEFTDPYYDRMEFMLGLKQEARPSGNGSAAPAPAPRASPPPRQRMSVPVSAPPTRESPSMATGRAPSHRAPLTADELYIAQQSGQTPEQYQIQKDRLRKLKEDGAIQ